MISVNGTEIAETHILAEMQYHPSASREEAFAASAEALVVRELLLQRASYLAIEWCRDNIESEDKAIDALLERELMLPAPSPAEVRRFFDNNRGKYRSEDLFEVSHILYLAPRDDLTARAQALAAAQRALAVLRQSPESFATIARSESRCASAGEGGRLGQVAKGETTPEFDTFLHALEDGQICPVPVETDYGVHVVKLDHKIPGRGFEFDEMAPLIEQELKSKSWARAVGGYISLLAASAEVKGIDLRRAASPLVQ